MEPGSLTCQYTALSGLSVTVPYTHPRGVFFFQNAGHPCLLPTASPSPHQLNCHSWLAWRQVRTGKNLEETGNSGKRGPLSPSCSSVSCQIGLKPCGWTNSGPQWLPKPDSFFIRVVRYSYMEKWLLFAPNSAWVLAHKTHGSQMMWLASNSLQPQITAKGRSSDNVKKLTTREKQKAKCSQTHPAICILWLFLSVQPNMVRKARKSKTSLTWLYEQSAWSNALGSKSRGNDIWTQSAGGKDRGCQWISVQPLRPKDPSSGRNCSKLTK